MLWMNRAHSPRRAVTGLTREARHAGMSEASRATPISAAATPLKTAGSAAVIPNNRVECPRVTPSAAARPMATPAKATAAPSRSTTRSTSPALALLIRVAHLHYLAATALAVEAAVLHNFYWHQRWTWRDRPAASWRESAHRLGRFHLLNGAISLAGNLAIVTLLAGLLDIDPVVASTVAIAVCSLLNFSASEALVFKAGVPVIAGLMLMSAPAAAWAGQGAPALRAWDAYAREIESRYLAAPVSGGAFFAHDLPGRPAWREAAARGEVTTARIDPPAAGDGRIHHWAGAIFVPGTSVAQVLERLFAQAGQEARFYEDVVESRLLSRDGD